MHHAPLFGTGNFSSASLTLLLSLLQCPHPTGLPVVLSLIVSPRSCLQMLKMFVPYMLFLPTHTMTFWIYALTRTFDLTWGNR